MHEPTTMHEAIEKRKVHIDRLRKTETADANALADALKNCRKGHRCRLTECDVCEYVRNRAAVRITQFKSIGGGVAVELYIKDIELRQSNRTIDEHKVSL